MNESDRHALENQEPYSDNGIIVGDLWYNHKTGDILDVKCDSNGRYSSTCTRITFRFDGKGIIPPTHVNLRDKGFRNVLEKICEYRETLGDKEPYADVVKRLKKK